MNSGTRAAAILALAALAGCSEVLGTGPDRVVGIVEVLEAFPPQDVAGTPPVDPGASVLQAPAAVTAGEAFNVVVTTFVPDGCWREAGVDRDVSGLVATLTPYDERTDGICNHAPGRIPREARITFRERGTATLRATGRRWNVARNEFEPAVVERTLVVR